MIPICILLIEDESDREFMAQLFVQYQNLMYSTIYKMTKDSWETEDILQITLEKLIDKISLLRKLDQKRLINYIISSCKNNAYNLLYRRSRERTFHIDDYYSIRMIKEDLRSVEEHLIGKDFFKKLIEIWPELDERSQYLLEARYILDKSTKEIGEQLNIKPESVRMALSRARKTAYNLLKKKV